MARRRVPAAFPSNGIVFLPPLPSVSGLPHLHLGESWSLLGSYSCGLSPGSQTLEPGGPGGGCPPTPNPVLGSAQLPLAQPVVRSAGLGPLPCVAGGGLLLRAGSVPLCCLVVSGSPPSGFPTSPPPRLQWPGGRSWGVAEGQCRRRPGAGLGDTVLSCLRP